MATRGWGWRGWETVTKGCRILVRRPMLNRAVVQKGV